VGHYEAGAKRKVQQTKNVREIWRETKTSDGIVIKAILHTIIGSNNNAHCGTTLSSGIIDTELEKKRKCVPIGFSIRKF